MDLHLLCLYPLADDDLSEFWRFGALWCAILEHIQNALDLCVYYLLELPFTDTVAVEENSCRELVVVALPPPLHCP